MKRIIFTLVMALTMGLVSNAQEATVLGGPLDHTWIGVSGGVTSPLDFNSMFPVNPIATVEVGKWTNPWFGIGISGTAWFGDNDYWASETAVKALYVGASGILDWTRIFGRSDSDSKFHIYTDTGLGWLHLPGVQASGVGAKTGIKAAWDFGNLSLTFGPDIWWGIDGFRFSKDNAQFGVSLGITWTKSGKTFEVYEISKYTNRIDQLRAELARKPKEVVKTVVETKVIQPVQYVIEFAQGSSSLTDHAQDVLSKIPEGTSVEIRGTASPEGTQEFNQALSERRAAVVADYLKKRGVYTDMVVGLGVRGEASNRLVYIDIK